MKTRNTLKQSGTESRTRAQGTSSKDKAPGSYAAYGDKTTICINARCVMRKQTTCFGFEGCPGFEAKG